MAEAHNVDAVLTQVINEHMGVTPSQPVTEPQAAAPVEDQVTPANSEATTETKADETKNDAEYLESEKPAAEEAAKSDSPIDEYGHPVAKPRMYSEDEVNRMMRERVARGRLAEAQPEQPVARPKDEIVGDENAGNEDWEVQLNNIIRKNINQVQQDEQNRRMQELERVKHEEFVGKFNTGMSKYNDFSQVVSDKPITDTMMLATRNLENPAAFVYAAAKLHPQELDRISRLDHYSQAAEIGRLHERMVKERKATSHAKPIELAKGDLPAKSSMKPSLEQRIAEHAKQKRR